MTIEFLQLCISPSSLYLLSRIECLTQTKVHPCHIFAKKKEEKLILTQITHQIPLSKFPSN